MPWAAALLALAALMPLTSSQMLSRERRSMPARTLTDRQFLAAFPAPTLPVELRVRDSPNTVCGYIGGDPALPATCMKGSHCAADAEHGIMGCCPDGHPCTRGIFTGCVDKNSGPQTLRDPYVFTCGGGDVCYRNTYDGGLYQFGCGARSRLATSVATTAPGRDPLDIRRITFDLTATPTPLSSPVLVGSITPATSDENQNRAQATASSSSGATDAPPNGGRSPNTGAIVGGIIGGVAGVVLLIALVVLLCRRRRRHRARNVPGSSQDMRFISPMADPRHNFEPLPSSQGPPAAEAAPQHGFQQPGQADARDSLQALAPPQGGHAARASTVGGAAGLRDHRRDMDHDRVPLTREVDGMSSGINSQDTSRGDESAADPATYSTSSYPGPRRAGGGALWQQNRRERRNLVWI
ncbi:hypothetical protein HIM_01330 [Hirsutella minnesotensis 3608]|nr:hypothetical protein HIM_01330 [Hirsutella minnesotensis 3608]